MWAVRVEIDRLRTHHDISVKQWKTETEERSGKTREMSSAMGVYFS